MLVLQNFQKNKPNILIFFKNKYQKIRPRHIFFVYLLCSLERGRETTPTTINLKNSKIMNYLVQPLSLVRKSKTVIGWNLLETHLNDLSSIYIEAGNVVEQWSSDWEDGDGFGSSDGTYMCKDYIDTLIDISKQPLETVFNPSLQIVKKS